MKFGIEHIALGLGLSLATPAMAQDAHDRPALQLASAGLELRDMESGKVDTIGFGTGQDDTVQFVSSALGDPESSTVDEDCGAGALGEVTFRGELELYFQAGEFVGWSVGGESGYATGKGVRIGMAYPELAHASDEVEAEESSIGFEFTADGLHGVLSEGGDAGRITDIWAGTTCIAR